MDSGLLNNYADKWVLISSDRKKVLAAATDLRTLINKIKKVKNKKDAIYHYVLPNTGYYAP